MFRRRRSSRRAAGRTPTRRSADASRWSPPRRCGSWSQDAPAPDPDWLESWRSADERAAEAILGVLAAEGLSEPAVAAELGVLLPEQATLFVASSMPVRDIESFWPVRADPPRVLCNRGANGIDGTVSSAFGAAAAGQRPGGAADRRRRARPRHRRPARRAAPGAGPHDRADRQRRRGDLRLPAARGSPDGA